MKKSVEVEAKVDVFSKIAKFIEPLYEKYPLSFLFIGPTGFYVKQIADKLAFNLKKTINRDAFMVVNQWATETLKRFEPNVMAFDRNFFEVFISREVELIAKEAKRSAKDERYVKFLKAVSRSTSSLGYILEIFERSWELLYEEEYSYGMYEIVDEIMNGDSYVKQLVSELIKRSRKIFEDRKNVYDPEKVYRWYVEELPKIQKEKLGKTLVLSGFFDLPPTIEKMLSVMFTQFEDIYALLWKKIDDPSFGQLRRVHDFFSENGFESSNAKDEFPSYPANVKIFKFKDQFQEVSTVTKMVKKLLISGEKPEDVAIVAPNHQMMNAVAENLKEMEVPHRFMDDIPLSESKVVKILLQPLKAIFTQDVEDLLALIEAGYGGQSSLSMDEVEELFLALGFMNDYENPHTRKKRWISYVDEKIEQLEKMSDEEDVRERNKGEMESLLSLKQLLVNIFEMIEEIEREKKSEKVNWYRKLIKKYIHERDIVSKETLKKYSYENSVAKELNALAKFEEVLIKVEDSISNTYKKVSFSMLFKIISNVVNVETFHASERYSNTVEIMDIGNARFVEKKHKFFIFFVDSYYPSLRINPLMMQAASDVGKLTKSGESLEKIDLLFSMLLAGEVYISYPESDVGGNPILPSVYLNEIRGKVDDFTDLERTLIPSNPEDVYSKSEKKIYEIAHSIGDEKDLEFEWQARKHDVGSVSHHKIINYVDCPLKYYLNFIADVKGKYNYERFNDGLIRHRTLKEVYDRKISETVSIEELENTVERHMEEVYLNGLYTYRMPKEVEVERIAAELKEFLDFRKERGCISFRKKEQRILRKQTIATEATFKTDVELNDKKYKIEARIDRFDELSNNLFFDISGEKVRRTPTEKGAYMLVDYKNSIGSARAEQLFLYDLVLRNTYEWREKLKGKDMYLTFFGVKAKKDKFEDKFFKRQDDEYIAKNKIQKKTFVQVQEFEKWLSKVLDSIENSYFTPIAIERKIDGFEKNSTQKCKGYKFDCEYVEICLLLGRLKGFELVK